MRIELLLFLSLLAIMVILIACSVPRRPTIVLSPTLFPQMTLTTYNPQVVSRVGAEAAIAATILPAKPRLPEVDISPPRCYRTISPQLTCLGTLRNSGNAAVSDITLKASFTSVEGAQSGESAFSLEQARIAAGDRAPYRLQVPDSRLEDAALAITLVDAQLASPMSLDLKLEDLAGGFQSSSNSYRLQAMLRNDSDSAVDNIRLIVALEDEEGALIGYRAADLTETLPSGAALPIDLLIKPLEMVSSMRHHVTVQASPATQP